MTPKAELHVHLEGTAPPALVRRLAKRNRVELPAELFRDDGEYHWTDFMHFLKVYDAASSVIRTPEDYRDVTYEYLQGCAEEGAIYVEVMSSPDHAATAGMSYANHLEGIVAGIEDARADHGIEGRIIVTCVRHFGAEQSMKVARQVTAHPHPLVGGFGMGGDEANFPPGQFARAFNYVADSGLPCTVHAGEWAGPESVWQAIETLPVQRIGHGVRATEDAVLMREIVARELTLEVCPGSNIATGIYRSYSDHPLSGLCRVGAKVTLSSDDPPYFSTSVGREYVAAAEHLDLGEAEMRGFTRQALQSAFVDESTRDSLLARVTV